MRKYHEMDICTLINSFEYKRKIDLKNDKSIQLKIAAVLREIGSERCIEKAETLEKASISMRTLHLRSLGLSASNVVSIANCFKQEKESHQVALKSISFSYNTILGDEGAAALAKHLPNSISEIGLVNCGISDAGGIAFLNWMQNAANLQMICIEQNNFSAKFRGELSKFSRNHPQILVVF